ncbi:hypothetical protein [Pseudoalteromonas luteoviolacea]|uniref:KAP NTPase domain-containing protein n=1 Tax=Pseudoalteromonas luteoviolacea S4060-1 TaxID=1365257 RepID=A0A167LXB9_9GAMM|nr:hypothetical protein [Pseudoalteromonas luteoviolacea]KZN65475.1 hypothetical protein N478_21305 [Pseudoalteromonas luteoviolacea S4060-1]
MSVELVKQQILEFISTDIAEVLAIKGSWGVGKTYTWEKQIEDLKNNISMKSYSYVSLFGVNSLEAIKESILVNATDTQNIGQPPVFKKKSKEVLKMLKEAKLPYIGSVNSLMAAAANLAIKDMIICFDDIERHSEDISIKDFMGLVSYLKEKNKCKVVLLLNEDAPGTTFEDYKTYKEKVVDIQLHFEPTAKESFDTMVQSDFKYFEHLKGICEILQIINKRVIEKIYRHCEGLGKLLENYDDLIKIQVITSSAILNWCYYSKGENSESIPDFEFVAKLPLTGKKIMFEKWGEEKSKKWLSKLDSCQYTHSDELDLLIADSIKLGFIDSERLTSLCDQKQNEIEVEKKSEKWNEAWDLFHASFDDNAKEVAESIEAGMLEIVDSTSCYQYSQGLSLLRSIDYDQQADELIDLFIEKRKSTPEIFSSDFSGFEPQDEKFKIKLEEAYLELKPKLTTLEVLNQRKNSNSFNMSDVEVLNELSEEEIYELFISFNGEELRNNILTFQRLSSSSEELRSKVSSALDKISSSSKLNKRRLRKFRR